MHRWHMVKRLTQIYLANEWEVPFVISDSFAKLNQGGLITAYIWENSGDIPS